MFPSHPCLGLISDEPESGSLLVDVLTSLHYPVVSLIPIPAHALSVLRAAQPAAILIDMCAHNCDAILALLDQVQEDSVLASVPLVVLLFDSARMARYETCLAYRRITVAHKPFELSVLLDQIEAAIRGIRLAPGVIHDPMISLEHYPAVSSPHPRRCAGRCE